MGKGFSMSRQNVRVCFADSIPAMESMEPRLLLSSAPIYAPLGEPFEPSGPPVFLDADDLPADFDPLVQRVDLMSITSAINELKTADPLGDASALSVPGGARVSAAGDVEIVVRLEGDSEHILSSLSDAGFHLNFASEVWRHPGQWDARGSVAYGDAAALAEIDGVLDVDLPVYPQTDAGSVLAAGDDILNADGLRGLLGVDGTGVNVGVISDGVTHWQAVRDAGGDLPQTISRDPVRPGQGDEGTAMLEIIHDLAPGADLFFSSGLQGLTGAINWLVNQGCDVIVDDLSIFSEPMFEDGPVAQAVQSAVNSGVTYVKAAGNWAQRHYQVQFQPTVDHFHFFDATIMDGATPRPVPDLLPFLVPPEGSFGGYLQWSDQWGNSGNDFSLELYEWLGGNNWTQDPIWVSDDLQNGNGDPFERMSLRNLSAYWRRLGWRVVWQGGQTHNREIELYTTGSSIMEDPSTIMEEDSYPGHNMCLEAIAVGAINAGDAGHDDIEPFNSRGPSTIYTDFANQLSATRHPMDIAGIDGVNTLAGTNDDWFGPNPFLGTSAAAPHIAGIAALLLEIDPNLTPAGVQDLIASNAVDLGDAGYDDVFGHGRADAEAIISPAPSEVDLVPDSDTGESDWDNETKLNNTAGNTLMFDVLGTVAGAAVTLYADGVEIGSGTGNGGTLTITTNGTVTLPDGGRAITVRQQSDGQLPSAEIGDLTVTVDTEAPGGWDFTLDPDSDTGSDSNDGITRGEDALFTGTAYDALSGIWKVVVFPDEGPSCTVLGGGVQYWEQYGAVLASLNEGIRQVWAEVYDVAGNSFLTAPLEITVDRTPPVVTVDSLPLSMSSTPALSGTIDDGGRPVEQFAAIRVEVDGNQEGPATNNGSTWLRNVGKALVKGVHDVQVFAEDLAGNTGTGTGEIEVDGSPFVVSIDRMAEDGSDPWTLGPPKSYSGDPRKLFGIKVTFSEDVSASLVGNELSAFQWQDVCAEDIRIDMDFDAVAFDYDYSTNTSIWTFGDGWELDPSWYGVHIHAGLVKDADGNELDGDGNGLSGDCYEYGDSDEAGENDGTQNVLMIPVAGDVDLDGTADGDDLDIIEANFGRPFEPDDPLPLWTDGDLTVDGAVDHMDYLTWKADPGIGLNCDTIAPYVVSFERVGPNGDPWESRPTELYQIRITFSEDVSGSVDVRDLQIYNLSMGVWESMNGVNMTYDPATNMATWDFGGRALPTGWYQITLAASGITDSIGNPLDGNADGIEGDDWVYGDDAGTEDDLLIPILGDLDLDGDVDLTDYTTFAVGCFSPGGWAEGDIDYSGFVDYIDYEILDQHMFESLSR